jgi:hypothetical protein
MIRPKTIEACRHPQARKLLQGTSTWANKAAVRELCGLLRDPLATLRAYKGRVSVAVEIALRDSDRLIAGGLNSQDAMVLAEIVRRDGTSAPRVARPAVKKKTAPTSPPDDEDDEDEDVDQDDDGDDDTDDSDVDSTPEREDPKEPPMKKKRPSATEVNFDLSFASAPVGRPDGEFSIEAPEVVVGRALGIDPAMTRAGAEGFAAVVRDAITRERPKTFAEACRPFSVDDKGRAVHVEIEQQRRKDADPFGRVVRK